VHDADGVTDETMLAFAIETRLAETTFVQSTGDKRADYRNRIFCMTGEMPFAGHPSLGTAVAVARANGVAGTASYIQQTGAGLQRIDVDGEGDHFQASMLQEPPTFGKQLNPQPLVAALGLTVSDAHPELAPQVVATGLPHVMLPLATPEALARIRRDDDAVDAILEANSTYGLYAVWPDVDGGQARARMFAKTAQTVEDPATGSAAGPLCAYLHEHTGRSSVEITQGVEMGRPSKLRASIEDDRVRVSGGVVAVVDGVVRL
jgi:trans-2,3-dihydro-3-hydroxyanthranilate isomerase